MHFFLLYNNPIQISINKKHTNKRKIGILPLMRIIRAISSIHLHFENNHFLIISPLFQFFLFSFNIHTHTTFIIRFICCPFILLLFLLLQQLPYALPFFYILIHYVLAKASALPDRLSMLIHCVFFSAVQRETFYAVVIIMIMLVYSRCCFVVCMKRRTNEEYKYNKKTRFLCR